MVSDGDYEALVQRVQWLENKLGTLLANGLDGMLDQNALEFGNAANRLSPVGIQARNTSGFAHPATITPSNAGVTFVPEFYNGFDGIPKPFAALYGWYVSADDGQGATLSSRPDISGSNEAYMEVFASTTTEANSYVKWGLFCSTLAAEQGLTLTQSGVALSNAWLRLHNDTGDAITGATAADGMLFYRTDLDVFRGRANGSWVSLATEAYVTAAIAAGGSMTMPVMVSTLSAQSIGLELMHYDGTGGTASATWSSSNRAVAIPFIVTESITVAKLWAYNGAAVSGNIDMGIYDAAFAKVVTIGTTAQAGTDVIQEFDIGDTALSPGRYYMAVALDNTTGTLRQASLGSVEHSKSMGLFQMASAFVLPTTLTPADIATVLIPVIGFSQRTLVA